MKNVISPFLKYLKDNICKIKLYQNYIYTDDKKSKVPSNPDDVLNSAKKIYENLYTREKISQPAINELLNEIPTNKKNI